MIYLYYLINRKIIPNSLYYNQKIYNHNIKNNMLKRLILKGFKSIREVDLPLLPFNIIIGANGAGKSNLMAFFRMFQALRQKQLQLHVARLGGVDSFLYYGRKQTAMLSSVLYFDSNCYGFDLEPTVDNKFIFTKEFSEAHILGNSHTESLVSSLADCAVYHFHDTSDTANVKRLQAINDNIKLRQDASNLAPFLYKLKKTSPKHYQLILKTIQQVAPFFGDFHLRAYPENSQKIQLEWTEKGRDYPFIANDLSDGTLRFICLATLLLQPEMPTTILIDEPELGLHPYAISVLAGLFRVASQRCQLIVSTQSLNLLDEFEASDVIVVDRENGQSIFRRLEEEKLSSWLEEYSLGELWEKNVIGGRPMR
jgi:predicted ATPase